MKQTLGNLERRLFAYTQMRQLRILRTGDLVTAFGIQEKQENKLFTRLTKASLIAQVRRGLYLVPRRMPLGAIWSPDEILALNALLKDRDGAYQICGPGAFHRYGYERQIPSRVYAYNNCYSEERIIGAVQLTMIKVSEARLGSTEIVTTAEGETGAYSSRVRTLLDAIYDWSRFHSFPGAFDWIRDDLKSNRVTGTDLVAITLKYGDAGTIRRMGHLLEKESIDPSLLNKLESALKPTSSSIPWIPTKAKRGTVNRRWGIVDNE